MPLWTGKGWRKPGAREAVSPRHRSSSFGCCGRRGDVPPLLACEGHRGRAGNVSTPFAEKMTFLPRTLLGSMRRQRFERAVDQAVAAATGRLKTMAILSVAPVLKLTEVME